MTSLIFAGLFLLCGMFWFYFQEKFTILYEELNQVRDKLSKNKDCLEYTQSDISSLKVDIAQIQTMLESVKEMLIRFMDSQEKMRK